MFVSYNTVEAFALKRNSGLSFPFLKENGELLSIAANSGLLVEPRAIELYQSFYDQAYKVYKTYPQFSRFILGIVTDLEALGQGGDVAFQIAKDMLASGVLDFETADSRRLDSISLFTRLDITSPVIQAHESRIWQNVRRFTQFPNHFTRLNKPLFYELTHMVFFLTDYGRRAWPIDTDIALCLRYAGTLAFLDDDFDLLSEICISLRFIDETPPDLWEDEIEKFLSSINITYDTNLKSSLNAQVDEYHPYLVSNWLLAVKGLPVFQQPLKGGTPNFSVSTSGHSDLAKIANEVHKAILAPSYLTSNCRLNFSEGFSSVEKLLNCAETRSLTQCVLSSFETLQAA